MGEWFSDVVATVYGVCLVCLPMLYGTAIYLLVKEAWK